jgi:hypothetical protein
MYLPHFFFQFCLRRPGSARHATFSSRMEQCDAWSQAVKASDVTQFHSLLCASYRSRKPLATNLRAREKKKQGDVLIARSSEDCGTDTEAHEKAKDFIHKLNSFAVKHSAEAQQAIPAVKGNARPRAACATAPMEERLCHHSRRRLVLHRGRALCDAKGKGAA